MSSSSLLKSGEWYLFVSCEQCHTKHLLFLDAFPAKAEINGTYQSSCPKCLGIGFYNSDNIERYLHTDEKQLDS
jgi:hypothetical protein